MKVPNIPNPYANIKRVLFRSVFRSVSDDSSGVSWTSGLILYIHRIHREEGEGFCEDFLTEHHRRLHGLRRSAWVDSYDLLRILLQEWARQHEPLFFLDTQGEVELSSVPAGDDSANIVRTLATIALRDTTATHMTGDTFPTMSDVDYNNTTDDDYIKTKWQRTG